MADVLAFENVSIDYAGKAGRQPIISDVSFSIAPGESLGLVGESGCGKSTVALAAMRYLPMGMRVAPAKLRTRMPMGKWTVGQSISGVAFHDVYHAGQIQLLKKLMKRR